jgi:hypothetical protein
VNAALLASHSSLRKKSTIVASSSSASSSSSRSSLLMCAAAFASTKSATARMTFSGTSRPVMSQAKTKKTATSSSSSSSTRKPSISNSSTGFVLDPLAILRLRLQAKRLKAKAQRELLKRASLLDVNAGCAAGAGGAAGGESKTKAK